VLCTRDRNHTARGRRAARQHSHRRCRVSVGDSGIDAIPDRRLRQGRTADWGSGRPKNRLGHHHQLLCWSTPMPRSGRSRRPHRAPSRSTSHLAPPHIFSPVLSPTRFQSCRKRFEVAMECVLTVGTRGWCSNSDVARFFRLPCRKDVGKFYTYGWPWLPSDRQPIERAFSSRRLLGWHNDCILFVGSGT
jgi:hypothetical protein